jgi:hypothetical protein
LKNLIHCIHHQQRVHIDYQYTDVAASQQRAWLKVAVVCYVLLVVTSNTSTTLKGPLDTASKENKISNREVTACWRWSRECEREREWVSEWLRESCSATTSIQWALNSTSLTSQSCKNQYNLKTE